MNLFEIEQEDTSLNQTIISPPKKKSKLLEQRGERKIAEIRGPSHVVLYTSIIHIYGKYGLINVMQYKRSQHTIYNKLPNCLHAQFTSQYTYLLIWLQASRKTKRTRMGFCHFLAPAKIHLLKKSIYFACNHDRKSMPRSHALIDCRE